MKHKDLILTLKETLTSGRPQIKNCSILVALSGGADSVCLLHSLMSVREELNLSLSAAHVNHMLRGEESERDKRFVLDLCKKLDIPCYSQDFDVHAISENNKQSLEEAGRDVRYSYFRDLREEHCIDYIATAHHSDDNAETVVMRFLRGSGLHGLSGIPFANERHVIRPLLNASRRDIIEYIENNELEYVTDSTNASTEFHRNKIRHELIPHMEEFNPNFKQSLNRNIKLYKDADEYLREIAEHRFTSLVSSNKHGLSFSLTVFLTEPKIMQHLLLSRCIQEITNGYTADAARIFDIEECIASGYGSVCMGFGITGYVMYNRVFFTTKHFSDDTIYPLSKDEQLSLPDLGVSFTVKETKNLPLSIPNDTLYIGKKKLQSADLSIRFRREGDYFYPSGFGHRKSLQNFFVDKKIPRFMRDSIPLLLVGNEIAWVCGHRKDDRFIPAPDETEFIKIIFTEEK